MEMRKPAMSNLQESEKKDAFSFAGGAASGSRSSGVDS